jgi:hypothetical protein
VPLDEEVFIYLIKLLLLLLLLCILFIIIIIIYVRNIAIPLRFCFVLKARVVMGIVGENVLIPMMNLLLEGFSI